MRRREEGRPLRRNLKSHMPTGFTTQPSGASPFFWVECEIRKLIADGVDGAGCYTVIQVKNKQLFKKEGLDSFHIVRLVNLKGARPPRSLLKVPGPVFFYHVFAEDDFRRVSTSVDVRSWAALVFPIVLVLSLG